MFTRSTFSGSTIHRPCLIEGIPHAPVLWKATIIVVIVERSHDHRFLRWEKPRSLLSSFARNHDRRFLRSEKRRSAFSSLKETTIVVFKQSKVGSRRKILLSKWSSRCSHGRRSQEVHYIDLVLAKEFITRPSCGKPRSSLSSLKEATIIVFSFERSHDHYFLRLRETMIVDFFVKEATLSMFFVERNHDCCVLYWKNPHSAFSIQDE